MFQNYIIHSINRVIENNRKRIYLDIECENGHRNTRLYDNIIKLHMCPDCAKEQHASICANAFQKYDITFVQNWLLEHHLDFVDKTEYINSASSFKYKCLKCGCIGTTNFGNLLSGRQCRGCSGYLKRDTKSFNLP